MASIIEQLVTAELSDDELSEVLKQILPSTEEESAEKKLNQKINRSQKKNKSYQPRNPASEALFFDDL
jgi:hypothetical protein